MIRVSVFLASLTIRTVSSDVVNLFTEGEFRVDLIPPRDDQPLLVELASKECSVKFRFSDVTTVSQRDALMAVVDGEVPKPFFWGSRNVCLKGTLKAKSQQVTEIKSDVETLDNRKRFLCGTKMGHDEQGYEAVVEYSSKRMPRNCRRYGWRNPRNLCAAEAVKICRRALDIRLRMYATLENVQKEINLAGEGIVPAIGSNDMKNVPIENGAVAAPHNEYPIAEPVGPQDDKKQSSGNADGPIELEE